MRKWKCVSVNDGNKLCFTVGKIYDTDDSGYGATTDSGAVLTNISLLNEMKCYGGKLQFIEVVEVKDFTKSDLQECDVVTFRNKERLVYFGSKFMNEGYGTRVYMYEESLKRNDDEKQFDIMQVYRNGILIFDRIEEPAKPPMQIEIESIEEEQRKLADRLSELRKGL